MAAPKSYKTGAVNRFRLGLWRAFGKGRLEDDDGNIIYDYLEVWGHREIDNAFQLDWTSYGKAGITSLEEYRFENVAEYWDVNGDPDYVSYLSLLDEMKAIVYEEVVYRSEAIIPLTGTLEVSTKRSPLMINDDDLFTLSIISGSTITNIDPAAITFTAFCDPLIDRAQCLKSNIFTIDLSYTGSGGSGVPYTLNRDDYIVCTYTYWTHTDMLRDADLISQWESGLSPDTALEMEFYLDSDRKVNINHIELESSNMAYPTGAKEYILQAVEETLGVEQFRVIQSGYLSNIQTNTIEVIKYDQRNIKKLKLVLLESTGGSFSEINVFVSDPDLKKNFNVTEGVDTLELEDFFKLDVIPYYCSPTSPDLNIVQGSSLGARELLNFEGGCTIYAPNLYNGAKEAYADYALTYIDVYYSGILIYKGIPSPTLSANNLTFNSVDIEENIVGVCSPGDFTVNPDVYQIFSKDYLTTNSDGTEQVFYTRFDNIQELLIYALDETGQMVDSGGNSTTDPWAIGVDYDVNSLNGVITLVSTLPTGYALYAKYKYVVRKIPSAVSLYVDAIRLFGWRDAIRYSNVRVYPTQYFLNYLPNNEDLMYKFEINPSSWADMTQSNQVLGKTIGGTYRKHKFGPTKSKFTIKGERISSEMYEQLKVWEQETEVLGLVDDMLQVHKGYVVPDSLQGDRRKTTQDEQDDETTSWTWSLTFQEV